MGEAQKEQALFATEVKAIPPEAMFGEFNHAKDVFDLASHVMEARMASAKGNQEEAIAHWRKAVEKQDTLYYDEPADWYYPVRESLGAALLSAGKAAEAEEVFREDLLRNPRNPRSLYGLKESLAAQQKSADAALVELQFTAAWQGADSKLTISDL